MWRGIFVCRHIDAVCLNGILYIWCSWSCLTSRITVVWWMSWRREWPTWRHCVTTLRSPLPLRTSSHDTMMYSTRPRWDAWFSCVFFIAQERQCAILRRCVTSLTVFLLVNMHGRYLSQKLLRELWSLERAVQRPHCVSFFVEKSDVLYTDFAIDTERSRRKAVISIWHLDICLGLIGVRGKAEQLIETGDCE